MEDDTIDFLVTAPGGGDRMFPSARPAAVISLAASQVRDAVAAEIKALARVFSQVDLGDTRYELKQVTLALNVSAEGKVQIIGGVGVSGGSALTVTLQLK